LRSVAISSASVVVVTYNEKLKRKQARRLKAKLNQLEAQVREAFAKHSRKDTKVELEERIAKLLDESDVSRCLKVAVGGRRFKSLHLERDLEHLRDRYTRMGKTIMFATAPWMSVEDVVGLYRGRNQIEDTFKLEKGPEGIPFRPSFCWTDSKLRVYAFTCVLALLIWRLMQFKLRQAGLKMSDKVLKLELQDVREIVLVYSPTRVARKVTERSSVQDQIVSILGVTAFYPRE